MAEELDWATVRARLAESQRALEQALEPGEGQVGQVLGERAGQLAGRVAAQAVAPLLQVLTFNLGAERYGVEADRLLQVLPLERCTRVPGAAPELVGVVSRRGEIEPVVDLARLLGVQGGGEGLRQVLFLRALRAGLQVERVEQVRPIAVEEMEVPGEAGQWPARYLRGRVPGEVLVLDLDAVLGHPVFAEAARR